MIWRLGVVPYLNAEPLVAALRQPDAALLVGEACQIGAWVPSQLVPRLLSQELDAALVSTAGVLAHPELTLLPDLGISSRGPVRSIQLYCTKPVETVRTVALDASSRSAVALCRVLFAEWWRCRPEYLTRPPHLPAMLQEADAALLIGNPALLANHALDTGAWRGPDLFRHDLGAVWDALTGLPFVYALWVAPADPRPDGSPRDLDRLARLLLRAGEWGRRRIGSLAARGAADLALPLEVTADYLTWNIRYDLGPDERAGMELFRELAVRHGILPEQSALRFAPGCRRPIASLP